MSEITTLSTQFRIYIPKKVREEQGWKAGQRFAFIAQGNGFVMEPRPTPTSPEASMESKR